MADRLTPGLLAAAIGSVLVFVSAFLTWSTVDARSLAGAAGNAAGTAGNQVVGAITDSVGIAGGRLGSATLALSLAALVMVAVMLLPAIKPWTWVVLIGFGGLTLLLALIDLVSIPRTLRPDNLICPTGVSCTFHRTIGPGVWFTVIAALVVVAGAYVHHIRPVPFRSHSAGRSSSA